MMKGSQKITLMSMIVMIEIKRKRLINKLQFPKKTQVP